MLAVRLTRVLVAVFASLFFAGSVNAQQPSDTIPPNLSTEAADSLEAKIAAIRGADESPTRSRNAATSILVTSAEMESFVFFSMKDEIPARVQSIDVTVEAGAISAATQLSFDSRESSGNPIVDILLQSSHTLFVKGALEGHRGEGMFQLQQVRVDGIPVPIAVIEVLVDRFVKPRFPAVDLNEGFSLPWGIEEIVLTGDGAMITY